MIHDFAMSIWCQFKVYQSNTYPRIFCCHHPVLDTDLFLAARKESAFLPHISVEALLNGGGARMSGQISTGEAVGTALWSNSRSTTTPSSSFDSAPLMTAGGFRLKARE